MNQFLTVAAFFGFVYCGDCLAVIIKAEKPDLIEKKTNYAETGLDGYFSGLFYGSIGSDVIKNGSITINSNIKAGKKICIKIFNINGYYSAEYSFIQKQDAEKIEIAFNFLYPDEVINKKLGEVYILGNEVFDGKACDDNPVVLPVRWAGIDGSELNFAINGDDANAIKIQIGGKSNKNCKKINELMNGIIPKKYNFVCSVSQKINCKDSEVKFYYYNGPVAHELNKKKFKFNCD